MKKVIAFISFCLLLTTNLISQQIAWKTKPIGDLLNFYVNPSGTVLSYLVEAKDDYQITFLNTQDTTVLWKKNLKIPKEELSKYFTFVDDSTFYLHGEQSYDFVDAKTGKPIIQIPSKFNNWKELEFRGEIAAFSDCRPYLDNNFVIYNSYRGIEIIDLVNKKLVYSIFGDFSNITICLENDIYAIAAQDVILFLNVKERKVDYLWRLHDIEFSSRFYKNFHLFDSKAIYYLKESVALFDFKTGKKSYIINDPEDYDYCTPLIVDSTFYFLISDKGAQTIYDVASQTKLIETFCSSLPGIIENVKETKDKKSFLLFIYDNNEYVSYVAKVEKFTNKILWKTKLFKYTKKYVAENTNMSVGSQIAISVAAGVLGLALTNKAVFMIPIEGGNPNLQPKTFFYNKLNFKGIQSSIAYAVPLKLDDKALTILCSGELYPYKPNLLEEKEEYISKINIETGELFYYKRMEIDPNLSFESADLGVKIINIDEWDILIGKHNLILRNDNNFKEFKFDDDEIQFIGSKNSKIFIQCKDDDDKYCLFYRFDLSKPDFDKTLVAQVFEESYIDAAKFENFDNTLYVNVDNVCLLSKRSDKIDETEKLNPIWFKFRDVLSYSKAVPKYLDTANFTQGITIRDDKLIIAGENSMSTVKLDGSCASNIEWDVHPKKFDLPMDFINNKILVFNNKECMLVELDCNLKNTFIYKKNSGIKGVFLSKNKTNLIMLESDNSISFMSISK